jgi:hypothetical protein
MSPIILIVLFTVGSYATPQAPAVQVISGIYLETLDHMIPYEASVPIFYQIDRSVTEVYHMRDLLKLKQNDHELGAFPIYGTMFKYLDKHLTELNDELSIMETNLEVQTLHTTLAPITKVLMASDGNSIKPRRRALLDNLSDLVGGFSESKESSKSSEEEMKPLQRSRRSLFGDLIGDAASYCCGLVSQSDISGLVSNDDTVSKYLDKVQDSVAHDHQNVITLIKQENDIANYTNTTIHQLKEDIEFLIQKINAENDQNFRLSNVRIKAIIAQAELTQNVRRFVELYKQNEVFQLCRARLIPIEVVPFGPFLSDLMDLESKLHLHNHSLAIPITNLTQYYKLPLVDCSFTPSQILLKITIPIRQRSIQLFEIKTTPFRWQNSTCIIDMEPPLMAVGNDFVIPILGHDAHQCQRTDKLCLIPKQRADFSRNVTCAKRLFLKSTVRDITAACQFNCVPSLEFLVTRSRCLCHCEPSQGVQHYLRRTFHASPKS